MVKRVEESQEIEDFDEFDEMFGQDEEKKRARERMREKLKETSTSISDSNNELSESVDSIDLNSADLNSTQVNSNSIDNLDSTEINSTTNKKLANFNSDSLGFNKINSNKINSNDNSNKINFIKKNSDKKYSDSDLKRKSLNKSNSINNSSIKNSGSSNLKQPDKGPLKTARDKMKQKQELKKNDKDSSDLPKVPVSFQRSVIKTVIEKKAESASEPIVEEGIKEELSKEPKLSESAKNKIRIAEEKERDKRVPKDPLSLLKISELPNAHFIGRKKSVYKKYGLEGALHVGRVVEEGNLNETEVYMDGLNPHVVFVCGARGSGKSYVLGVIAEELAIKNKNVGIIVVDPIGVFWSMKHPNKEQRELDFLAAWKIKPRGLDNLKVFIPVGMKNAVPKSTYDAVFSIQPSLLNADDWCLTFGIERFSPTGLLMEKVIDRVKRGYKDTEGKKHPGKLNTFSIDDVVQCLDSDADINSKEKGYKTDSIRALASRFDAAKNWGIFDENGTPLSVLSRENQLTIMDTSFLDDNVSALVIGILSRRLLAARKLSTRKEAAGKFKDESTENLDLLETDVPPTWLFIDEAHTLIPGGNQKTPASNALVEYVKQGRRPGCSLVFATQQPSAIDSRVLSQLDIIMSHKLIFDDDIKSVYKRTPTIIPSAYKQMNFIKTLPVGKALTGDRQEETSRAFPMVIRPRMSQHEGREAETVEVKRNMNSDQVKEIATNMLAAKLRDNPYITKDNIEQVAETLGTKYRVDVDVRDILAALGAMGFVITSEGVSRPGEVQQGFVDEITEGNDFDLDEENLVDEEADEESDADEGDEESIDDEEDVDGVNEEDEESLDEDSDEESDEENINTGELVSGKDIKRKEFVAPELLALNHQIDMGRARKIFDKFRIKKKFGFFGKMEIIDDISLKYIPIYRVKFNFFPSNGTEFNVCETFIDSFTGEFIHYKNKFLHSKGLSILAALGEIESALIISLYKNDNQSLDIWASTIGLSAVEVESSVESLLHKKIVEKKRLKNNSIVFCLAKEFDFPFDPMHQLHSTLSRMPVQEADTFAVIPPYLEKKELPELLKKIWGRIIIKDIHEVYLPVYEATMKTLDGITRKVRIDAITGKQINIPK